MKKLNEKNGSTDYSCLMAYIWNDLFKNALDAWSKSQIKEKELDADGRETEPHITVLYGFHENISHDDIRKALFKFFQANEPFEITLGKISRFSNDNDVLKVDIISEGLKKLHYFLRERFKEDVTISFPDYHPHMTIAYLKKGKCPDLDGSDIFEGISFKVDDLIYSSPGDSDKDREKYKIDLTTFESEPYLKDKEKLIESFEEFFNHSKR